MRTEAGASLRVVQREAFSFSAQGQAAACRRKRCKPGLREAWASDPRTDRRAAHERLMVRRSVSGASRQHRSVGTGGAGFQPREFCGLFFTLQACGRKEEAAKAQQRTGDDQQAGCGPQPQSQNQQGRHGNQELRSQKRLEQTKNLSVNNIIVDLDFSEGHDGGCQVVQCDEATIQLFVSHQ